LHDLMQGLRFSMSVGTDEHVDIVWQKTVRAEFEAQGGYVAVDVFEPEAQIENCNQLLLEDPPAINERFGTAPLTLQRVFETIRLG